MPKDNPATQAVRAFVASKGVHARVVPNFDGKFHIYTANARGWCLVLTPGVRSVEARLSEIAPGKAKFRTRAGNQTVLGRAYRLAQDLDVQRAEAEARRAAADSERAARQGARTFIEALT